MGNLSQIRRAEMLEYLNHLKEIHTDDESRIALSKIETALTEKKYGLVWEEHEEEVDKQLVHNIPVFREVEDKKIIGDNTSDFNFLLEGDNLHSLKLLEKTHKGKVDVIYIDPPYNTGSKDFAYNDLFVDKEDGFRHSKWISFMEKRLMLSKKILSENGIVFISIDDNEYACLKLICNKVFGENNFLTTIGWEKRTKCQNTKTARKMLQPKIEYVLVYKNYSERAEFNCHVIGKKDYSDEDERGHYRIEEIGQMSANGVRGRGSMIFPILDVEPRKGNQWKIGKATVTELKERNDLVKNRGKVYRKIRPEDESNESIKPFWAFFSAEQYGTAENAKSELSDVLGTKEHGFETVKPLAMIEELLFQASKEDSIILDFFAGSGTTGQAVLELNKDYGGHRKYILCTDNENDICEKITYQRLKNIQKELPHNLKYYKTEFIPKLSEDEEILSSKLLDYIKEMVELENMCEIDGVSRRIILSDGDLNIALSEMKKGGVLYIPSFILLTNKIKDEIEKNKLEVVTIPDYYFTEELREVNEL